MIDDLLLISGNDIPFIDAQISIHQPTIKEIGYITEETFFTGCELLNFSKDILKTEDKTNLETTSNFEVFMSIMRENNKALSKSKLSAMMVLTLIFPSYRIYIERHCIRFDKDGEDPHYLNEKNFETFKEILVRMFCLKKHGNGADYNPGNKKAQEIANKLRRGREIAAAAKGEHNKIAIFSRYVSILAIGKSQDINSLLSYTVYQLFDEFERYELKYAWDLNIKQKLAGAKDVKEVDNWMKDIHEKGK